MDFNYFTLLILLLIIFAGPLLAIVFSWRGPRYTLVAGSLVSLCATIAIASARAESFPLEVNFGISIYVDSLAIYFMLLVNITAFVAAWYIVRMDTGDVELGHERKVSLFRLFFGVFYVTLLLIPVLNDLFMLWLVIELTTVVSVILLLFGSSRYAPEAGWKYFIVTIPGLLLTFVGTVLLALTLPINTPLRWSDVLVAAPHADPQLMRLVFIFVLLGYGAKAGLAPAHTWLPDVHGEAPAAVSAMLSGILLKVALLALVRWSIITNAILGDRSFTSNLFLFFAVLSLSVATLAILKRNKFKRVLAYHSVEHMGIIAFGLGIGSPLAIFGALLHIFNHAVTKELMFLTFNNIQHEYAVRTASPSPQTVHSNSQDILQQNSLSEKREGEQIRGALKSMPLSGSLLALGGLSLVGSPPFNIFLSELIILWSAVAAARSTPSIGLIGAILVFLISVTLIFGGLVSHLSRILLDVPPFPAIKEIQRNAWPLFLLLALMLMLGLIIPVMGPFNMPQILERSTCIILGGSAICQ